MTTERLHEMDWRKTFLAAVQSAVGEGAVCTHDTVLKGAVWNPKTTPEGDLKMMIRKTNSGNDRAAGFSVGRAAVAVALTGVMGLGLVACNDSDDKGSEGKSSSSSSSEMTTEEKMTEEKMTEEKMTEEKMTEDMKGGAQMSGKNDNMMESGENMMPNKPAMSEKMPEKMSDKMDGKTDGKMKDKVENMMETDESMMPDLQGKHNH